jgi:uncharacterized protein
MPEDEQVEIQAQTPAADPAPETLPEFKIEPAKPRGIAPIWHTLILVLAILAYSVWGAIGAKNGAANPIAPPSAAAHAAPTGTDHLRIIRYAFTGAVELAIVVWIAFGLRLRKVSFRSLFGTLPKGLNEITMEILTASAFWVCSMIILLVFAFSWLFVQNHIYQHEAAKQSAPTSQSNPNRAQPQSPEQQQSELIHQLTELAPANGIEIEAWGFLCLIVGFSEELIFRGYLQSQAIALLRNTPIAVMVTAVIFGAAHGYQGVRGIFLISIFGSLFGILTLLRKNLLPGMIAHSWHDFATGMALALIRSSHLLEHLPKAPK